MEDPAAFYSKETKNQWSCHWTPEDFTSFDPIGIHVHGCHHLRLCLHPLLISTTKAQDLHWQPAQASVAEWMQDTNLDPCSWQPPPWVDLGLAAPALYPAWLLSLVSITCGKILQPQKSVHMAKALTLFVTCIHSLAYWPAASPFSCVPAWTPIKLSADFSAEFLQASLVERYSQTAERNKTGQDILSRTKCLLTSKAI